MSTQAPQDRVGVRQRFAQDGFAVLPSVIPSEEAERLAALVEERYRDPRTHGDPAADRIRGDISLMRIFEAGSVFRDLLEREPVIDLAESILGEDCHVVAQNALRTPPGRGIVRWHIDDALFFPFLAAVPDSFAPQDVPCHSLNVLLALSDIEADLYGPTQVVAGSHLSGRIPAPSGVLAPGTPAVSLHVRAGDAYLVNSQTWHRGATNNSDRTRYILTATYGRRFISQRFYPFLNYRMPPEVIAGASPRLLRLLGAHEKGAYG